MTSCAFFRKCDDAVKNRSIGLLDVTWLTRKDEVILPSARTLAEAIAAGAPTEAMAMKRWLDKQHWLSTFKALRKDPAKFHAQVTADDSFEWDFDRCCEWSLAFRVLTPVANSRFAKEHLLALQRDGSAFLSQTSALSVLAFNPPSLH